MPVWIKICGNTSLEDALLAVEAGADAVGFVFAPGPRQVTVAQVAAITPHLPPGVEKIGVFVDAGLDDIASAVERCGLTGVQLHFEADAALPTQLRARFGVSLRILRVTHFDAGAADRMAQQIQAYAEDASVDGLLVDSRTATAVGGTGVPFDWVEARQTVFHGAGSLRLIAAGGLKAGNVAEAIRILQPWGVDVVSGVEASPGLKDPEKMRAFVRTARQAALQIAH